MDIKKMKNLLIILLFVFIGCKDSEVENIDQYSGATPKDSIGGMENVLSAKIVNKSGRDNFIPELNQYLIEEVNYNKIPHNLLKFKDYFPESITLNKLKIDEAVLMSNVVESSVLINDTINVGLFYNLLSNKYSTRYCCCEVANYELILMIRRINK